ncbi:hypothetical protein [Xenorhabdus bovienii]|uniref:hypothetical protein n=1 Tax=Xenorhabdus bovienii TaxID=40576 RepID=UPI003DA45468
MGISVGGISGEQVRFSIRKYPMNTALTFKEHEITPFDNSDNKIWFTGEHLAELLGYKDSKKVANLYESSKSL